MVLRFEQGALYSLERSVLYSMVDYAPCSFVIIM